MVEVVLPLWWVDKIISKIMLEKRKVRTFLSKVGHIEKVHYLYRGRGIFSLFRQTW